MLRSLRGLESFVVRASDGEGGNLVDVVIDRDARTIRSLLVCTGGPRFIAGRHVLIPISTLRDVDWSNSVVIVALSLEEIFNSPIAHQDPSNARRASDLCGFSVRGPDGALGRVTDLMADDDGWRLRYVAIAPRDAAADDAVFIALTAVTAIDWAERNLHVHMTRAAATQGFIND